MYELRHALVNVNEINARRGGKSQEFFKTVEKRISINSRTGCGDFITLARGIPPLPNRRE
jgi:hypothetical protein